MSTTKPMPWLKVWVEMPWDFKIRQLDLFEKWIWVTLLCLTRRSDKPPEIRVQDTDEYGQPIEDSEWRPATVADIAKIAKIKDSDWKPEFDPKFTGQMREFHTKPEFMAYLAIEHFKQLAMVVENAAKVLVVKHFTKRQHFDVDISSAGHKRNRGIEEKRSRGAEEKKSRKGRGSGKPKTEFTALVYDIFHYWQDVMGKPSAQLSEERKNKIRVRLNHGYTVEQIKKAIDGCKASDFHMGRNERNTAYNDLELICRNDVKLEQFIARAEQNHGGLTYGRNGKPSNLLVGSNPRTPEDRRREEKLTEEIIRRFGKTVPDVRKEPEAGIPPAGSGESPGA